LYLQGGRGGNVVWAVDIRISLGGLNSLTADEKLPFGLSFIGH